MQVGKQDEFQHKRAFILMMTLKCFKTIKNSNDEMALVNINAGKFEYSYKIEPFNFQRKSVFCKVSF